MNTNNEFGLVVRSSNTYINILNAFDNNKNIVEINGIKHNLTLNQLQDIKKLVEKNLTELIKISKKQTPSYLNKNGLDGYGKNITILIDGISVCVNFAVTDEKTKKLGNNLIDSLTKIFTY